MLKKFIRQNQRAYSAAQIATAHFDGSSGGLFEALVFRLCLGSWLSHHHAIPVIVLDYVPCLFLSRAMANVTYFVALPFMILDDGTHAAGEAKELPSAHAAISRANALALKEGILRRGRV